MPPPQHLPDPGRTEHPFRDQLKTRWARVRSIHLRQVWWAFLDSWEQHKVLRRTSYAVLALALAGAAGWYGAYPWWNRRNAVRIARQWLAAQKLGPARQAAQTALEIDPGNPEVWQLAAEIARESRDFNRALYASSVAVRLKPQDVDLILGWASDALTIDRPDIATQALAALPAGALEHSALGQRIAGEVDRRHLDFASAIRHFENAAAIEGPVAVDEVPMGIVLLSSNDPTEQSRGRDLLRKWSGDGQWGATTLRALLEDALRRDDRTTMRQLAQALRANPHCTFGDFPNCLLALSRTDETLYGQVLADLERKYAVDGNNAAQLVGWLNQIGQSRAALQWTQTLPETLTRKPPLVVGIADALRQESKWDELLAWTKDGDWGKNIDLIRVAYRLLAARRSDQDKLAGELWQTLRDRAGENGNQAFFAAANLYGWGLPQEAVTLLWSAADQAGSSIQALGMLARHYQMARDALGQYRVFRKLYGLRANDPDVANNFAFFAALTGNAQISAETIARANFAQAPDNATYRSTYAFVLITQQKYAQALELMRPVSARWQDSPAAALAYGLALAGTGRKGEARQVLNSIHPGTLTVAEVNLILSALQ